MIYSCLIKANNESDVLVSTNNVDLLCFSNIGIYGDVGDVIPLDIDVYDEFEISKSNCNEKSVKHISGYQYKITGILNVDKGGVDSLIFFPIDDLCDYSYLDNEMVELNVIRLNISNID